ncbi:MAG: hypothetical protein NTZ16_08160 [Verrucomicrobia bacterium]|nr:hypothetical protein [Verrucomicrobiota bacterium]
MALPELIEIVPLTAPVRAEITVPGSKSITNRALVLAALADGETTLTGALWSEDTQVMVECLQELGFMVNVAPDPNEACNRTIAVYGQGGKIPGGGTAENPLELFVGNAGTAARFLAAMVCLGSGVYRLHGVPRMHERPQAALFAALRQLGYRVEAASDKLPATIYGRDAVSASQTVSGKIGDGNMPSLPRKCTVSIADSSQFASALLLCARQGGWDVKITGENADESPYVAMTTKLIEVFPQRGGTFQIEPDASSGSYFIAAGQLELERRTESKLEAGFQLSGAFQQTIQVVHWPQSGWQIDQAFQIQFAILQTRAKGFSSTMFGDMLANLPSSLMDVSSAKPSLSISRLSDLGDSVMTAVVISPFLVEPIQFTDLARLRVQECERVVALRTELTKCGAKVVEDGDTLTVYPSRLHGAEIETYSDHRMAMCFAILGLKVPGIKLHNPACVKKTFPNFFQKLAAQPPHGLGATILDGRTGRKLTHEDLFAD